MPEAGLRYWAFLSYSHADLRWARRLHRALEAYVVPRRLVGRPTPGGPAPRRLRPVFRDLDEMGAGGSLSDRLKRALDASASLVVVCSPAAAVSPWVNEEIRRFKAERGEDRILAVIVGGEPFASERPGAEAQECFPKALRHRHADDERIEPIAADLRPGRDSVRAAVLKLVAGVLDIELDELVQRDAARRNRQLVALTSVFGLTAATMTALAIAAINEADQAKRERGQAEKLVQFMISDLKDKLQPAGRLDILDAIGARAQAYYAAEDSGALDAAALGQRARVLHLLGDIQVQRGNLPAALALFQQAGKRTGEMLRRRPRDPAAIYNHAQSVFYIGEVAFRRGDSGAALTQWQAYQGLARQLATVDPGNLDWQAQLEEADTDVGVVLLNQARAEEASRAFEEALDITGRLVAAPGAKRDWQWDEAQSFAWLADAEVARGQLAAALADRRAEGRVYEALIAASPHDNDAAVALANSRAKLASIELASGGAAAATHTLQAAAAQVDELVRHAPDNDIYQAEAVTILQQLAQALLQDGQLGPAAVTAARANAICDAQLKAAEAHHDAALKWRGERMGAARVVAMKIAAAEARSAAAQRQALQSAPDEAARLGQLLAGHPHNPALAVTAAEAALLAGDVEDLGGDPTRAAANWARTRSILTQGPQPVAATDPRTPILLRQASYRLSSLHPPTGPLPASGSGPAHLAGARRGLVDYRW